MKWRWQKEFVGVEGAGKEETGRKPSSTDISTSLHQKKTEEP